MNHLNIYEGFFNKKKDKPEILAEIEGLLQKKWLHNFKHYFENDVEENFIYIKLTINHNITNVKNVTKHNYNDHYKEFIELINYLEKYTDFYMGFGNGYLIINSLLFNKNVKNFINDLSADIETNKYNL